MSSGDYVLLDRDGVINVDLPTSVRSLEEMRLIEGAPQAIAAISNKGYSVLVVTNQAVVARGQLKLEELERIHRAIEGAVQNVGGSVLGWYVCTHGDSDGCDCRKPKPGLILRAAREHGFVPADTWFVGDADRDVHAAIAAGCRPALVRTGKGAEAVRTLPEVPNYATLMEFADSLVDRRQCGNP